VHIQSGWITFSDEHCALEIATLIDAVAVRQTENRVISFVSNIASRRASDYIYIYIYIYIPAACKANKLQTELSVAIKGSMKIAVPQRQKAE